MAATWRRYGGINDAKSDVFLVHTDRSVFFTLALPTWVLLIVVFLFLHLGDSHIDRAIIIRGQTFVVLRDFLYNLATSTHDALAGAWLHARTKKVVLGRSAVACWLGVTVALGNIKSPHTWYKIRTRCGIFEGFVAASSIQHFTWNDSCT